MAGEVATGIGGGALEGASIGSFAGPYGAAIGAVGGAIYGGIQGANANSTNRKATAAANAIPLVDPTQQAFLNGVQRRERQMRAATDPSSAFAALQAKNNLAQTDANIVRGAGGNSAALTTNLLRAQAQNNQVNAQIGANASNSANQLTGLEGGLVNDLASRRLKLQEFKRNQLYAQLVGQQQNLNDQLSGGIGLATQMRFNGGNGMNRQQQRQASWNLGDQLAGANSGNVGTAPYAADLAGPQGGADSYQLQRGQQYGVPYSQPGVGSPSVDWNSIIGN